MGNHFHMVVETPEANLVKGMKWLLGTRNSCGSGVMVVQHRQWLFGAAYAAANINRLFQKSGE